MSKNSFQSSEKKSSKKETHFLRDTAGNIAGGSTAATVTNILGEIVEDAGEAIANKILPGSGKAVGAVIDFAIDSGTAIILNEGLEVSRDGESFFNDDFIEDALVAVASNATGAVVVGILGVTGAPALALGLLTSAVMGAAYSVATSLDDRFALPGTKNQDAATQTNGQTGNRQGSSRGGATQYPEEGNGQNPSEGSNTSHNNQHDPGMQTQDWVPNTETSTREEQSEGETTWETYNVTTEEADDGTLFTSRHQKEYDSDGNATGRYRFQDNESGEYETKDEWEDHDHDGVDSTVDKDDSNPNISTPNPMDDNGDTSNYDGRHDGLRGFRGDIDYGPDGKQGQGYNGEHDELIGLNPRIDYGPDGKQGQGYNGEHDDLKGLNPRIDWDQDHVDTGEFTGNALTDRLGKINPRAIQETLNTTAIANNGRQAKLMGSTDSEFIFDAQAGILYHNANGTEKGFGSGGAIAEFEIDQDLSLVSVDFL